jgi:hypothetical protein
VNRELVADLGDRAGLGRHEHPGAVDRDLALGVGHDHEYFLTASRYRPLYFHSVRHAVIFARLARPGPRQSA